MLDELLPGDYIPTVDELCGKLPFSHGTLVRALSGLAEEGIIGRPASRQRYVFLPQTEMPLARIAMIRPDYPSPSYDAMVREVYRAGKDRRWHFQQRCFHSLEGMDLNRFIADVDAAVFLPTAESLSRELLNSLRHPQKPVVLLQQHISDAAIPQVCVDDLEVGRIAARHLAAAGHRHVLLLQDQPGDSTIRERIAGWREEAARWNIETRYLDSRIPSHSDARSGSYQAYRADLKCNGLNYSAIFTTSDTGAAAVFRALREEKISVPEEISVCAYAGEGDAGEYMHPKLSAVEFDVSEYGRAAVETLASLLAGIPSEGRTLRAFFTERESIQQRNPGENS